MKKGLACLVVFLIVVGSAGLFFLSRSPVVIVVDDAFLELYGKQRADTRKYVLSLSLMRQVMFAVVSQEEGREAAEFVVSEVSKEPFLALFPERYLEGADRYAAAIEEAGMASRAVVLDSGSGDGRGVNIGRAEFLRIDRETSLYRAGMCAAILAKEGSVVVYYQDSMPESHRNVFTEGLAASGYTKAPFFYRYTEAASQTDIGCAVLLSAVNTKLLEDKKNVPTILFSWLDPEYTPNGVAVVFDDSLPALADQVAKGGIAITARARVLKRRVPVKSDLQALKTALRAERPLPSTQEDP